MKLLTQCPVFVVLWSAFVRTFLPHDIIGLDHRGHKVVWLQNPLNRKGSCPGELKTGVTVVTHCVPLAPGPDISERLKV